MSKWNLIIDVAECTNCQLCTLSAMDLKCWYSPSWGGLLYEGTVIKMASTPSLSASLLMSMLAAVAYVVEPASMAARSPTALFVAS